MQNRIYIAMNSKSNTGYSVTIVNMKMYRYNDLVLY